MNGKTAAILFGVMFAIGMFVNMPKSQMTKSHLDATSLLPAGTDADVKVVVSRQDSEGLTQDQLSLDFLRNLEAYTAESARLRVQEHYARLGEPVPSLPSINFESNYVEVDGVKLALIRVFEGDSSNGIVVFGIRGPEVIRILCTSLSKSRVEVTSGKCGETIRSVFGVDLRR